MKTKSKSKSAYATIRLLESELESIRNIKAKMESMGLECSISSIIRTFLNHSFHQLNLKNVASNPAILLGGLHE